jgi:hypothetical protein
MFFYHNQEVRRIKVLIEPEYICFFMFLAF